MAKRKYCSLHDTGLFYESLAGKTLHTSINRGGGVVLVGIEDNPKKTKQNGKDRKTV